MLQQGTYETRNSRMVKLRSPEQINRPAADGSQRMVTMWTGDLMKADGKTVDSQEHWDESNHPSMLGSFVSPGKAEGVANPLDLIRRIE